MSMLIMPSRFGGNATLWTPADLAVPPVMWQNEASSVTLDASSRASLWGDLSGNSNYFGGWGATSRDATVNASGQNGKRTLSFDGTAQALGGTGGNAPALTKNISALSIFFAGNPTKTAASFARLVVFSRGTDGSFRAGIAGGGNNITAYQRRLDSNSAASAAIAQPDSSWHVYQSEHDWVAATVGIRVDGGPLTSTATGQGSGNTSSTNSTEIDLMGSGTTSGQFAAGSVGEVIVLNYIPSAADRQKIEGYLEWRWGTQANLPADHPYKGAAPTV